MSRILVGGWGAVSPAGWGVPAMRAALEQGAPLPVESLAWPGSERTLSVRAVPAPSPRPAFLGHPRLRRASIYTVAGQIDFEVRVVPPGWPCQ